jgi:epoxyqueuosine reductase QueG
MKLDDRIQTFAEECGADLFGVSDLSTARDYILSQGGADVANYPRAISIGIALLHTIVDQLPKRAEAAVAISYRHHAYDIVNERLDIIASRLAGLLQKEGYRAYPVLASRRVDDERLNSFFSHKLAAHLAGLGWIGKSCLLITPDAGPRVRWATVLTDAPLVAGHPMQDRCGDCLECVQICPVHAFTGRAFRENEPREARYDARKCEAHHTEVEKKTGIGVCGLCVYVCPFGRRRSVDWN